MSRKQSKEDKDYREGVAVYNPAFDVTPASLIRAIFTEKGAIEPVNRETVALMLGG